MSLRDSQRRRVELRYSSLDFDLLVGGALALVEFVNARPLTLSGLVRRSLAAFDWY